MSEPPITLQAIHTSKGDNLPVRRIVIHSTSPGLGFPIASVDGQALATAKYFQKPSAGGSAHYIEDGASEQHCVADDTVAWHAPPNPHSIGIELCGEASYTREQWLSDRCYAILVRGAARLRELCDRHDVPLVKLTVAQVAAGAKGVCGHVDVSQAFHDSSHWDPGPGFPWDIFMAMAQRSTTPEPGTSTKGNSAPIPGPAPSPAPDPAPTGEVNVAALPIVRQGSTGQPARNVQGLLCAAGRQVTIDGDFGARSAAALVDWQHAAGLTADGICGPHSWATLLGV